MTPYLFTYTSRAKYFHIIKYFAKNEFSIYIAMMKADENLLRYARAHLETVVTYKMICKDTVEEKITQLQQ
ncbi:MAG: hypothetical protein H7122_18080 [Chitinophagaceae bacterium]|nr:hypothetical protein [Chitinophagaceae bacterium]